MESGEQPPIIETEKQPSSFDALIVLGSGLVEKDGRLDLGKEAKMRAIASAQAYQQELTKNIIFTGGKTHGQNDPSEAAMMRDYISRTFNKDEGAFKKIPEESLLTEEESKDTSQNISNIKKMVQENNWESIGILSNEYHLLRAERLAHNHGIESKTISAEEMLKERSKHYNNIVDQHNADPSMEKKIALEKALTFLLLFDKKGRIPAWITEFTRGEDAE